LGLVVKERQAAADTFAQIFETRIVDDVGDPLLGAKRMTLAWGRDQLELLEPTGPGPVATFLEEGRRGLFFGGFSLGDPAALAAHLEREGVRVHECGPDRFVVLPSDLHGTGTVLSKQQEHERVGLNDAIWQITYAVDELDEAVATYRRLFKLEGRHTSRHLVERFGYDSNIIWFDARDGANLDSLEFLDPNDPDKAVARFVRRSGQGIYMGSIITDEIEEIKGRISSTGPGLDNAMGNFAFIHPLRLHGLLLGLTTFNEWNRHRSLPEGAQAGH
jgi:hypothetical protein